jgi:hypothetical protein
MIVCREIRKVAGGFIVEVRHPYGDKMPFGEVVCTSFEEVIDLLKRAALVKEKDDDGK